VASTAIKMQKDFLKVIKMVINSAIVMD